MKYEFTERALESLSGFAGDITSGIQDSIKEAAAEHFYNHDSYSCIYDDHGNPWDKLDFKDGNLNHRVFFTEIDGKIFILEVFDRDRIDYSDKKLYNLLDSLEKDVER